jgi:hypothetical protein
MSVWYPEPPEQIQYHFNFTKLNAKEGNPDCFFLDYLHMATLYDGFYTFWSVMILLVPSFFNSLLVFVFMFVVHKKKHVGEVGYSLVKITHFVEKWLIESELEAWVPLKVLILHAVSPFLGNGSWSRNLFAMSLSS